MKEASRRQDRYVRCILPTNAQINSARPFQLIDFMITTHAAYPKVLERAEREKTNIHSGLLKLSALLYCLT